MDKLIPHSLLSFFNSRVRIITLFVVDIVLFVTWIISMFLG